MEPTPSLARPSVQHSSLEPLRLEVANATG
jgi:hypothetical protein